MTWNLVVLHMRENQCIMDDIGDEKRKDKLGVQKVGKASGGMGT